MNVSEKIVIDLTKPFANVGKPVAFCGDFVLNSNLLPYPDAKLEKVSVLFDVIFTKPDVEVEGKISCQISGSCDRCTEEVHKTVVLPFFQTFFKDGDDTDSYVYEGSKLDATKAVEDEIVLSLPTLLLCKPDCKGLCAVCGANKNKQKCGCDATKENVFSQLKNLKF